MFRSSAITLFFLLLLTTTTYGQQSNIPTELAAQMQKAQSSLAAQQFEAAEKTMESTVQKFGKRPEAWYLLGYARHAQQKFDDALEAYEKANELWANRASKVLCNMACIHSMKNEKDQAFEKLDLAVKAGFSDFDHLQSDAELENIRLDPRFKNYKPTWLPNADGFPFRAGKVETVLDEIDAGTGGLNIDADGRLYTADFGWRLGGKGKGGNKVWRVSTDGKAELFCETLRGGSGNTFDKEGNLYQSNIGGNFITKISPDGNGTTFCKDGLRGPVGLAFNSEGTLFACNCGSNSIQQIDESGKPSVFCADPLLNCPNGIAVGPDDTIYVCNFSNGDVIKIDREGKASKLAALPGNNNGHLIFHQDTLIVIARTGCRIFLVDLEGKAGVLAGNGTRGKADGAALKSSFSLPNSLILGKEGKYLYVNETSPTTGDPRILGPTRIRKIELIAN